MGAASEPLSHEKYDLSRSSETSLRKADRMPGGPLDLYVDGLLDGAQAGRSNSAAASLSIQRLAAPVLQRAQRLYGNRASQQMVTRTGTLQRHCECGGTCAECREKEEHGLLQRRSTAHPQPFFEDIPNEHGEALDADVRRPLEAHFGADLRDVRVHGSSEADRSAGRINAAAYTHGRDIYFAAGMYAPSTDPGRKLLAHEVAHVVQQASGKEPAIAAKSAHGVKIGAPEDRLESEAEREAEKFMSGGAFTDEELRRRSERGAEQGYPKPGSGVIQRQPASGSGGVTAADMAMMRQWLETGDAHPSFGFGSGTSFGSSSPSPFNRDYTLKPYQTGQTGDVCPNCHQTPAEIRAAAQRRQEEWQREQRKRQREAAWPVMVEAQHEPELSTQDKTLFADVQTGELTAGQLRLQMFDRALAFNPVGFPGAPLNLPALTPAIRDTWAGAQQATTVLEALLHASKDDLPAEVIAPFHGVYQAFYLSLSELVQHLDIEDERTMSELSRPIDFRNAAACPGGCHQPAGPSPFSGNRFSSPAFGSAAAATVPLKPSIAAPAIGPAASHHGPRMQRLDQAIGKAEAAMGRGAWQSVIADFHWATSQVDAALRSRLVMDPMSKDMLDQFDYSQNLLSRQRAFLEENPEALKIQAIFYPKYEFTERPDEKGVSHEAAKGIPWLFYLVRTPIRDERFVPVGFEWQLHDITAPRRDDGRTLKLKRQVTALEALEYERRILNGTSILDIDPPVELFEQLNHRDFFPEGMLYWHYPVSGRQGQLETTAPATFGDWLTRIGMTLAILGSLVFAPFSTPMLIAVGVGTALSIAGRVANLEEMKEHGTLTQADLNRFYWDVALDVVSAITLGLGRVATVSARAGNLLRAASVGRAYFVVRRVQIAMDVVNVGLVTHDLVTQYQAIMNSNMTEDQRRAALTQLTVFAMASGVMSIISLRGGLHDWNRRLPLSVGVDPGNPSRLVGDIETPSEHATNARSSVHPEAKFLQSIEVTHPDTGETHSYAIWSNGRITRCSGPPCPINAESVVTRLEDLRSRMLVDSEHLDRLDELIGRARRIQAKANQIAETSTEALNQNRHGLLNQTSQLEEEIVALERGVRHENELSDRTGRDEARLKYGDGALDYDTKYYRWVRKRDGTLEFQRRSMAVPWREFNSQTGKFEITHSLFEPVDAGRLKQLRETSLTKDFVIAATVDNVAALRRLRPASEYVKPHPGNWVLVRINDDNLVQFITEPVAHGVIFEFPDGSRVWRTPQNTIATEGALRGSIGRRGFEQTMHPQLRTDVEGESNEGIPAGEATGVEHERAHPRGQGTGFELMNHIPLAPTYVNQELQARGIELFLRELKRIHPGVDFRLSTEHSVFPGTLRQARIDYHIDVVTPSGRRPLTVIRIGTDYSDPLRPAEVEMRWLTKNEADLALMEEVDMPAALQALEERIGAARRRSSKR